MSRLNPMITLAQLNTLGAGHLPGLLGMEILAFDEGRLVAAMNVTPQHLAPNGYLHGGSVVSLADTACGYATILHLPEGGQSFTTIELKTNYLGTTRDGRVVCTATARHLGKTTQVWDAEVVDETSGKTIALFRCSNVILYPQVSS